jgi:hypothetical protein
MSLGVTRICRLRRLGPGVHAGSSSRGQSFRYHLSPTRKKAVSRRGREGGSEGGSLSHEVPAQPPRPLGFLVTKTYKSWSLGHFGQDPHEIYSSNISKGKTPCQSHKTSQKAR